jgi:YggT family protein
MNVFSALIVVVQVLTTFFIWVIIISSILSFILPPYHPVREAFGRILNPMLDPIRRMIPPSAGLDFSPLILYLIVQVVSFLLVNFLSSML